MGLDMYLESFKKTNDLSELVTLTQLEDFYMKYDNTYYSEGTREEAKEKAKQFLKDNNINNNFELRGKIISWLTPFKAEIYWRKANAIHIWFVENVQNSEDDCNKYEVSKEQIKALLILCDAVLKDNLKAKDLLPTQGGFFFGGIEYDEWYFEELQETSDNIKKLLKEFDFENRQLIYCSSW